MKQTKLILKLAIDNQKGILEEWKSATNPQEKKLYQNTQVRLATFEAVLQSLEGNHSLLRTYL